MIFCFSGTGNSRYIAQRIAEGLQEPMIDLNARIKANNTTTVDTGSDVIMVTPTYAWRIPKIVSEWMEKTKWTGAKRIWFVMDCGSEIGNAAKYNRSLAEQKQLHYMGTAQIIMPVRPGWMFLVRLPLNRRLKRRTSVCRINSRSWLFAWQDS